MRSAKPAEQPWRRATGTCSWELSEEPVVAPKGNVDRPVLEKRTRKEVEEARTSLGEEAREVIR